MRCLTQNFHTAKELPSAHLFAMPSGQNNKMAIISNNKKYLFPAKFQLGFVVKACCILCVFEFNVQRRDSCGELPLLTDTLTKKKQTQQLKSSEELWLCSVALLYSVHVHIYCPAKKSHKSLSHTLRHLFIHLSF